MMQLQQLKYQRGLAQGLVVLLVLIVASALIFYMYHAPTKRPRGSSDNGNTFDVPWKRLQVQESNIPDNLQNSITRFFHTIRSQSEPLTDEASPYVIELDKTPIELLDVLNHLALEQQIQQQAPLPPDWRGAQEFHQFSSGETVKTRLEEIALAQNVHFIWWLDRDYVVKSSFSSNGDFLALVSKVARTVNDDYQGQVAAYICYPQHALLLVTEQLQSMVPNDCQLIDVMRQPDVDGPPNLQQQAPQDNP